MSLVSGPGTEIVVVGAGPAGLATAIGAALEGARVVVVERRRPPLDKACGEGLMPDGLDCLRRLGVELEDESARPIVGIRYLDEAGATWVEGRFPDPGAGIRRPALHRALVRRAEAVGVHISWQTEALSLKEEELWQLTLADGDILIPDLIVLADGLRSRLAVEAGLASSKPSTRGRFGVRRHFRLAPWTDHVEVYWSEFCEAYVTPTGPQEVGVALLWDRRRIAPKDAGFEPLLRRFPGLTVRLREAEPSSKILGTGPLRRKVRGVELDNIALVGDASGYVDAITGEGLSIGFHQAVALVESLREGDLRSYGRRCREIRRLPDKMTELLLALEQRPALRRYVFRALGRDPAIFERFLAVHARAEPASSLLRSLPAMGRALSGF